MRFSKKNYQKIPFFLGGHGTGENRQTYHKKFLKNLQQRILYIFPVPDKFFHAAEISAQNYGLIFQKNGQK